MTDAQIRAALGLLRKTLPDLAVTQLEGGDTPLVYEFHWRDAEPVAALASKPAPPTIDAEATDVASGGELTVTWQGK